jgi:hypothetical protein
MAEAWQGQLNEVPTDEVATHARKCWTHDQTGMWVSPAGLTCKSVWQHRISTNI